MMRRMAVGAGAESSDLGRRIREARVRAGLTQHEAAERAGMAPGYLVYLETRHAPGVTQAALTRLAAVLATTPAALAGAGMDLPPGERQASASAVLTELSERDCQARLAGGGVGRFLFADADGPVALPVNYALLGDDIVFRTSAGGAAATAAGQQAMVAFEVDHLDEALAEGWSVLARGPARVVTDEAELRGDVALGITPWAGGDRPAYIRLAVQHLSGRRIRVTG